MYSLPGLRVRFRDITADDAYVVCRWRNTASARETFFTMDIVTPDTHRMFLAQRKPHDLIWIAEMHDPKDPLCNGQCDRWVPIAMLSLTVDVEHRTGEYGRAYLDETYRGQGLWVEIEHTLEAFAFDVLQLDSIWLDIYADNRRMIDIHLRGGWRECGLLAVIRGRQVVRMGLCRKTYQDRSPERQE